MKAYVLRVEGDDDQGQAVVFSKTAKEAKKLLSSTNLYSDRYTDIRVKRCPEFDNMETLSEIELAKEQWRNGWRWYDYCSTPDSDEATDDEFYNWYKNTFLGDDSN